MTSDFKPNDLLESAIQEGVATALKELHTCLPGQIISFDDATQTADIQPTIKMKVGENLQNLPVLSGVPVRFPKSADFSLSFPLAADDEVLLIFSERSLDTWLTHGGIQNPFDVRRHDLSDAFAVPMAYSQKNLIPSFPSANLEMKANTGSAKVELTPATEIILNSGSDFAVQFSALQTAFDELKDAYNGHDHVETGGTTNPPLQQSAADISLAKIDSIKVP